MRALLWFVGSIVVLIIGLWLNAQFDSYQLFKRELVEFHGLKLGASRLEARYALGYPHWVTDDVEVKEMPGFYTTYDVTATAGPTMIPKGKTIEYFDDWNWNLGEESVGVVFDPKTKLITSINCYVNDENTSYPNCSGIGSITAGDSEDSVIGRLGQPDRVDFPERATTKTLIYDDISLEVDLSKREVY
jgi:hypothetical protein